MGTSYLLNESPGCKQKLDGLNRLFLWVCVLWQLSLSAGEFHLREQRPKKRCGTAAWKCCRIIYPASLSLSWARSLTVLPSWELPSNSSTKESRNSSASLRTRSVYTGAHASPRGWRPQTLRLCFVVCRRSNIWPSADSFSCASLHLPSSPLNCSSWGSSTRTRGPAEHCCCWPRYNQPRRRFFSHHCRCILSYFHASFSRLNLRV